LAVRLILDAHVSGRAVGGPLRELGHDVRALDQERQLEALSDDELLELAAADERILVTHNVADFPRILRKWAEAGRSHGGVMLVYGIDHREFGLIVRGIDRRCVLRPHQGDWLGMSVIVDRTFASTGVG
jgi:hypothetical protein